MPVCCFGGQVYTEKCDVIREDDVTKGVRLHLLEAGESAFMIVMFGSVRCVLRCTSDSETELGNNSFVYDATNTATQLRRGVLKPTIKRRLVMVCALCTVQCA